MSTVFANLLNTESKAAIDEWLAKYPYEQRRSALLPALHIAQAQNGGYLSDDIMQAVADYMDLPKVYAYEAATFYSMYELKPVGRHKVSICNSICCMLRGGDELMEHVKHKLKIDVGQTTEDGRITLKEVECLAACGGAPAMMIDERYYENLTPENIDNILDGLE